MKIFAWFRKNIILIFILAAIISAGEYYLYIRRFSSLPDSAAGFLENVYQPLASDRVLIFSPHFDDETIAAGGYIQRAESQKSTVEIVAVTDSNHHKIGGIRQQEFINAVGTFGIREDQLKFLGLPDYFLSKSISSADLEDKFNVEIASFKPTIIIYPDPDDENRDHQFIGQVMNNILSDRTDIYAYTYIVHFKYYPQPVGLHLDKHLMPPIKLLDFSHSWQKFDLTSAEENQKEKALEIYKSQLRTPLLHDLLVSMVRENELFSAHNSPTSK